MKIISPVDNLKETPQLIEAGADELYGGYLPPEWQQYNLAASLNQRTFAGAQIETQQDLHEIIKLAHRAGVTFALTLNAPFYSDDQMPLLVDYVGRMLDLGVDSLILADLALLRILTRRYPDIEYHASTLAHLTNAGSVQFVAEQGIQRVVLPRHLTVADIAAIVRQVNGVRFDAFFLVGKCPNSEGLCTFHHSSADKIWPCEIPYDIKPLHDGTVDSNLHGAMQRQASWSGTNRRHGCGLCAVPCLQEAGIHGLKLVGRGAPAAQKVRNIVLTREFLALARDDVDFASYRRQAMAEHSKRFGAACHQNVCYYPEYFYQDNLYGDFE